MNADLSLDENTNRFVAPAGVTGTYVPTPGTESDDKNISAFGYSLDTQPSVTRATVNGSAKVAALVNQTLLGKP